jgi:CPA2 family monovalent cation:H+ antiporter-2
MPNLPPPILAAAAGPEIALLFIELGLIFGALALAARLCNRIGISPIPLFLVVGMFFGVDGLIPVTFSEEFIAAGAEIGVILLLFMLGLEYTGEELSRSMRTSFRSGVVDLVLNFLPGFLFGLILGWDLTLSLLLGGITYISSSGIISKLLSDTGWLGNRESPAILSILVFEDLVMAIYLPLMGVLLIGGDITSGLTSLGIALVTVIIIAVIALRFGGQVSRIVSSHSNEIMLLSVLGVVLLVGGVAQRFEVSAAVGAFLMGIALSKEVSEKVHELIAPLKDLFAAVFFVFFGLQITPSALPPVLLPAIILGVITAATKLISGMYAARRMGVFIKGQVRAGTILTIRGEFSIVIAGLAATAQVDAPGLAPLAAAYVLLMAVAGPIFLRFLDPIMNAILNRGRSQPQTAAQGASATRPEPEA